MSTTETIFQKGDAGRRYRILNASDKAIREWSRKQYLTFEAAGDSTTVTVTCRAASMSRTFDVSTDGGTTWESKTSTTEGVTLASLNKGGKAMVKCVTTHIGTASGNVFSSNKDVFVYGDVMSLVKGDNFLTNHEFTQQNALSYVFQNMTTLRTDPKKGYIILPATDTKNYGYWYMFAGCTGMTVAPIIDATTARRNAMSYMFYGCTSLAEAPEIHVTTFDGAGQLDSMFVGCSSLVTPPKVLPATTATSSCYNQMFALCTALKTAPKICLTTTDVSCCSYMFDGCSSLEEAPELLPTSVKGYCYRYMFRNCTSLKKAMAVLPATNVADYQECYSVMFYGCSNLEEGPILPATALANNCYNQMFRGCSKLKKIVCLATTITGNPMLNWVNGVSATGTFVKHPNMSSWGSGNSGIPSGWTIQDYPYIMTDWSNPEAMRVMYAKGFAASPEHMTKAEAEAVTSINRLFSENTKVLSFDELRFFTSVNENLITQSSMNVLYWASYCKYATIPNNWTKVGNGCVGGGSKRNRIIYGPNVTDILNYNFYSIGNATTPCNVICLASTPPTITGQNQSSLSGDAIVIYVPDSSVSAYQADSVWGQSTHILPISQCPADLLVYHDLLGGSLDITPYTT